MAISNPEYDVIVVGAGPSGVSAAITAVRKGLSVLLLERGEYPGAKNVQGAVLYTKMLDDIIPNFWEIPGIPLERYMTEHRYFLTSKDSSIRLSYDSEKWKNKPHNCYTIIRTKFDRWYAQYAEKEGVELYSSVLVSDIIQDNNGAVCGIKTGTGDTVSCSVVIACDGVNSLLAQKVGLIDEWKPSEVALGVKEIIAMNRGKIEDRFCLEGDAGATIELFGDISLGMLGYGFIYTNKDTLSVGVGCRLSDFQKSSVSPYDLLQRMKQHPSVKRILQGGISVEYSSHLIPEGGYHSMPPLYKDGFLIAGDAAQMINPVHREGSNLAMTAGKLAAETVFEAKKVGDFSSSVLCRYQDRIQNSYILPDLYDYRNLASIVDKNPQLLQDFPDLFCQAMFDYFSVDGRTKKSSKDAILKNILHHPGVRDLICSTISLKNFMFGLKTLKAGIKYYLGLK